MFQETSDDNDGPILQYSTSKNFSIPNAESNSELPTADESVTGRTEQIASIEITAGERNRSRSRSRATMQMSEGGYSVNRRTTRSASAPKVLWL